MHTHTAYYFPPFHLYICPLITPWSLLIKKKEEKEREEKRDEKGEKQMDMDPSLDLSYHHSPII